MEYLTKYDDFLLKNASQITGIEASLRSLTYILPGKKKEKENSANTFLFFPMQL